MRAVARGRVESRVMCEEKKHDDAPEKSAREYVSVPQGQGLIARCGWGASVESRVVCGKLVNATEKKT